jgi:putative holliday junction resolvase
VTQNAFLLTNIRRVSISLQPQPAETASSNRSGYTGGVIQNPKVSAASASFSAPVPFKILALDYGRKRIGLALADSEARIAEPYTTLERINRNEDIRRLREFIRRSHVAQIIVGLPLRLDGTPGEMAGEATRFAQRLRKQLGLPVELVDERLSSWEAERILEEEMGRRITHTKTRDGRRTSTRASDGKYNVDAVAAMVILREYLARTSVAKEPV